MRNRTYVIYGRNGEIVRRVRCHPRLAAAQAAEPELAALEVPADSDVACRTHHVRTDAGQSPRIEARSNPLEGAPDAEESGGTP